MTEYESHIKKLETESAEQERKVKYRIEELKAEMSARYKEVCLENAALRELAIEADTIIEALSGCAEEWHNDIEAWCDKRKALLEEG
jgi:hypothetical protein